MYPVEIKEITDLIQIRQYLSNTMGNPVLDKPTVNEMNNTLILIDKKIVGLLKTESFKEYIGYEDVRKVVEEAARTTNIKFGMKNNS